MAKVAVTLKILFVWLYNGFASLLIQGTIEASLDKQVLNSTQLFGLILFTMVILFLPEILFTTWSTFRKWIMAGAEDGDGVLHSKDLKELGILYISLWSMRMFMGFSVAIIFGVEIGFFFYALPLVGSFGTAGLSVLSKIIGKR